MTEQLERAVKREKEAAAAAKSAMAEAHKLILARHRKKHAEELDALRWENGMLRVQLRSFQASARLCTCGAHGLP